MLNTATKGYAIYTDGVYRGETWHNPKARRWHVYQPNRGRTSLRHSIITLPEVKAWLEVRMGAPVELRVVYW